MKKLIHSLIMLVALVAVGSCAKETMLGQSGPDDAKVYLRLTTPKGFSGPQTRALTFDEENTIEDIYVLVFNSADVLAFIKEGEVESSTPGSETEGISGHGEFSVTLEPSKNSSDSYRLVVLANAEDILAATVGTDDDATSIGDSYADVAAAIQATIAGKMYEDEDDNLVPMWGEKDDVLVQSGNANHSINLTRAIARVDVGVGEISGEESDFAWSGLDAEDAEIPFELGHVYVMRPSNTYGVMPYPSAAAGAPSIPTGNTLFSLAQSTTTFNYAATASSTGGHITQEIYTPESNVLVTTTGVAGDANHVNRTAIVVGGYYDGSATETFYRLDFSVDEKLVNILRNHLYLFSISSVSGPGYSDPGTAYENQSMNMTVNIYDWTETDMKEIFLDGTNYVKLGASGNYDGDERESLVYRGIGSQDAIEIDTNIPLDQFTLTLDNGGALPDEEDPSVIENERFRAELVTGDDGKTYFVFTALAEYDPAATDNPSLLTIANGRIKFEITIRQAETDPADWGDGGGIDFSYDE